MMSPIILNESPAVEDGSHHAAGGLSKLWSLFGPRIIIGTQKKDHNFDNPLAVQCTAGIGGRYQLRRPAV